MWHLIMWREISVLLGVLVCLCGYVVADTMVHLNVNRPFNDVNENFVSFALKPEELYDALDGPNRKSVTNMAALLGDAYVKFVGDFYFASHSERKLRNPTKIIWKGFNRWTRAVNWTMIIPVPYTPNNWDSMHTLKILNTSYMVGITDCIWQLGTNFGKSRANDYVNELNTLKLMVDTFRPYVDDWRMMGADISAGSSADETRRYVNISRDMNTAFGWTQPENILPASSLGSYIYESDPALRTLLAQRVPVWLSLPAEAGEGKNRLVGDEITDALRWAQTLGDAASSGFDVVFKHMSLADWQRPNYSFYVTALFKKVMGSRVFPARPLNMFVPNNKLYTHCANAVSGGLAFMVVNTEDQPLTITVRSLSKLASNEVWQYTLTSERNRMYLNNVKLSLNSTLRPQIKTKTASKPLQLVTPSMSVSFWVLPTVNLEHCQFTEVEADDISQESSEETIKSRGNSAADRLLKKLIEETSVSRSTLQSALNRHRRFVLEDNDKSQTFLSKMLEPWNFAQGQTHTPLFAKKRSAPAEQPQQPVRRRAALEWLSQVLEQTRDVGKPKALLQRSARSAESFAGPLFYNKRGKTTSLTKKITEIRKPEKNVKPLFDFSAFNEEEFFKKIDEQPEPEYTRLPEGDVHLKLIDSVDGEEDESEPKPKRKKVTSKKSLKIVNRHSAESSEDNVQQRTLRLLPTEFYEALPNSMFRPQKPLTIGAALNSLLFPAPFSKKADVSKQKAEELITAGIGEATEDIVEDVRRKPTSKGSGGRANSDFLHAQKELGKTFLSHITQSMHAGALPSSSLHELSSLESSTSRSHTVEALQHDKGTSDAAENFFKAGEQEESSKSIDKYISQSNERSETERKTESWWDLTSLRRRRALRFELPEEEALHTNMIDRETELVPLGPVLPQSYRYHEYRLLHTTPRTPVETRTPPWLNETTTTTTATTMASAEETKPVTVIYPSKLISVFKSKVTKFVHIIRRHVNEWYNTITKHTVSDASTARVVIEQTTAANAL